MEATQKLDEILHIVDEHHPGKNPQIFAKILNSSAAATNLRFKNNEKPCFLVRSPAATVYVANFSNSSTSLLAHRSVCTVGLVSQSHECEARGEDQLRKANNKALISQEKRVHGTVGSLSLMG